MRQHKAIHMEKPTLGTCYYPEHWDESLWADDLRRMHAHGIEVVRVFEFAWNLVEPYEDVFDFSLFDRFLALAQAEGMQVIMCTPTATPPAWLTTKYPEVLNADIDGNLMHHGHRRHYSYNSPKYQYFTERIVKALAQRYGMHPTIIGWQIDNEINCEIDVFYADADREAFRVYLKNHFGTLEALNEAIGANFWSQTYTDWAQVDLSRRVTSGQGNPHMALLEKRFFAKSALRYVQLQADILRRHVGERFITTNGIFGHLDSFEMTDTALDFITFDSYPNFAFGQAGINGGADSLADREWGMHLSRTRAISPNFGVMEQQSGANGWDFTMHAPMPRPGQMRLWTLQSIAHGADFVSYFRWRTCAYGTEMYWHGLNDYSNQPNRRLKELAQTHADLSKIPQLAGAAYVAKVALAQDYLNEWDGERDKWHGPLDAASRKAIYAAAQHSHTPMNLLWIRHTDTHSTTLDELAPYALIFYPHATILTEETAALLTAYVQAGGTLVMGARTGYKDAYGRCPMQPMPGLARDVCGVEVIDYTFVRPQEAVPISWHGRLYDAPTFHDVLSPIDGGEGIATFKCGYYDGACAMTVKRYEGGGAAYYVGSGISEALAGALLQETGTATPHADTIICPPDIELACREKDGARYYFLLNYTNAPQTAIVKAAMTDAFEAKDVQGEVTLPPYGAKVLLKR